MKLINKNTFIARTMNMLDVKKDKEISACFVGVAYADDDGGFMLDGPDDTIMDLYLTLTKILADEQNINVHDFLQKVDRAFENDLSIGLERI